MMLANISQLIKSAGSLGTRFLKHESGLQVLCFMLNVVGQEMGEQKLIEKCDLSRKVMAGGTR
jgi:GTPase involved in cell partitioning and DNA repair